MDLFDPGGSSAMIGRVDRLSWVVAEIADAVLDNGPKLFPENVCALKCQELLKVWRMGCKSLVHVRVEITDVGLTPLVISSCCSLEVVFDVASQFGSGSSVLRM